MNKIEKAILFAVKAHAGQSRKGTERAYILHLIEVMAIVKIYTTDEDVLTAALLHDTANKASVTLRRIEKEFGSRVARLVESVSEDKMKKLPPEATWRARKWQKIFRLRNAEYDAKLICLGDTLSDLRDLQRAYAQYGDGIWESFHQKNKDMHAWYYRELLKILEKTFEYEYCEETEKCAELIDSVFGWERKY